MSSNPAIGSAVSCFLEHEKRHPQRVFLRQAQGDAWIDYSWAEVGRMARSLAQGLRKRGLNKGDRVAILAKNCAPWIIADLAIMMAGCVSVPLYPNQSAENLRYCLEHSGSRLIFIGKLDPCPAYEAAIPTHVSRVKMPGPCPLRADEDWDDWLKEEGAAIEARGWDELLTIIYTSGTGGLPKGVMHSSRTMAHATMGYAESFAFRPSDRFFSYLPLSHVAERIIVEMGALSSGASISFAESLERFPQNLRDAAPTVFFSVPRLWKKFQEGIHEKIAPDRLQLLLKTPLVGAVLRRKIQQALGLHRARLLGSGAAPLDTQLHAFYNALGLPILEGYGLTECFGYASANRGAGRKRPGSVGTVQPRTEIVLGDNQEIWVRNEALMLGYYQDARSSEDALKGGYLRTGDSGYFDEAGHLYISGRIKDEFKTDSGKYVSPAKLEQSLLKLSPGVEQICITGRGSRQPVALCVLTARAQKEGEAQLKQIFASALERINADLEKHEKIACCVLLKDEWTVESGMMTPTLKVRRQQVEKTYENLIARAATHQEPVLFN